MIYLWLFFYTDINCASASNKSFRPVLMLFSQGNSQSAHSIIVCREAVILWKRLRWSLPQEEQERSRVKRGWREYITLVSLLRRILAGGRGGVIFVFLSVSTLHSFLHLIDAEKEKKPSGCNI